MQGSFAPLSPLDYFALLVQDDDSLPLLEAVVAVAQDEYPELDVQSVLGLVDQLQQRLQRRVPADASALQRVQLLNQFFFRELGFGGNVNHFHDPDNSFVHVVLRTRRGIPVSLAVLWLELARGAGLDAHGVNCPGHFLVKVQLPQGQAVIDPMTGVSLSREDLSERLEPYKRSQGLVDEFDIPVGLFLEPAPARAVLARVLHNLKELYRAQEDWPRMIAVCSRLIVLLPDDWAERRDRGLAWAELGEVARAVPDLEAYLAHAEDPLEADAIALRLGEWRRAGP